MSELTADPWTQLRQALAFVSAYLNGTLEPGPDLNWALRRIEEDVPVLLRLVERAGAAGASTETGPVQS